MAAVRGVNNGVRGRGVVRARDIEEWKGFLETTLATPGIVRALETSVLPVGDADAPRVKPWGTHIAQDTASVGLDRS